MQEHRLALKPGYQLDYFRIESVLGKGGFGITYLAMDLRLGKRVAIKELLPDSIATRVEGYTVVPQSNALDENWQWARERFLEEARVLAGFSHPAIVGVHLLLEAHGTVYMVMDYVEGESYEGRLKRIGREPDQNSLMSVMGPILDGLEEVHAKGLMHRDIKPENILINGRGQPVLIDFGSARESVGKTMTMTSIVTHGYSPIEQYQTKGRMGPWTDIYAMGAVMCRAMTGEKPPVAADRLMDDDLTWLSYQKLSGFSDGFRQAIDWSLRVRPEERPQSVGQWMGFLHGGGAMHNRVSATTSQQRASTAVSVPTIAGVSQGTPAATEHRAASRRGKILAVVAVCFLLVATVLGFAVSGFVGLLESRNAAESTSKGAVALPGASVAIPNAAVPTQQTAATDDQNGSSAPVGDAQGEPVELPAVSSSSAGPSPQPMRAMLIGDSFSVGAFGQRIGDLLMQQFGRERVCIFASCGSSPEDWVEGGFITDCGYRQTTPADSLIYGDGTAPNRPVKTPSLGKLLELYRPEFVIVQLGTNWMDKLSGPDHPGETYYRNLIDSFVQEIRKQNPAAKIFWILPPSSTKYASRIHEEVEKWINEASRSLGFFTINSRSVMGPFRGGAGGGDGVHMTDSAAQSWAAVAYTKFARATEILGVGSSPGGTSPPAVDAVLGNPPSSGELQIFSAGIDALFPAGYAIYDDSGKFLKRVDGPVSAHLKGQTSGKAFIRGAAYLSDWSYQRMQQGHSPNWMAGDPQIDSSRGSDFSGGEDASVAQSSTGTQANQNGATPAAEVLGIPPAGQLQIFGANVEVFFPQGYTVFDDNGRFLKRVNGPVSAAVRGQTSGKPFARGILYLSDWSFERMQQDHSPNWISGEAFVPSQGNSEGGC